MKLTKKAMEQIIDILILARVYLKENPDNDPHKVNGGVQGYFHGLCALAEIFDLNRKTIWDFIHGRYNIVVYPKMDMELFLAQLANKDDTPRPE